MKIVHIILGKANPNRMNGINKVVHEMVTTMVQQALDAEVWGITPNPRENDLPDRDYPLHLFEGRRIPFRIDPLLRQKIYAQTPGTVFHIHGGFIPAFYTITKLLHRLGHPYLHLPHGAYNQRAMEKSALLKKIYFRLCEKQVVENSYRVQLIGESEARDFDCLPCQATPVVIPNGQNPDLPKKTAFTNGKINFGFMGRLDMVTKGLDLLLEGYARFRAKSPVPSQLLLIGGGADEQTLRALATHLDIQDHVHFTGPLFGDKKQKYLLALDAFFHPSRNEGLPGAVLETAAMGLPQVVSEGSNMRDMVQQYQAGIGLEQNSVAALENSMTSIAEALQTGKIVNWSQSALEMIEKQYSWHHIVKKLTGIYTDSLKG